MKNILHIALFITTVLLLSACKGEATMASTHTLSNKTIIYLDTININGQTIYLEHIDTNEFLKIPAH